MSSFFSGSSATARLANANERATARPTPSPAARLIFLSALQSFLSFARFSCRLMLASDPIAFAGWLD